MAVVSRWGDSYGSAQMHVSRKADYSVRALSYLAEQPGRRVLIHELAQEMAIPRAFL